MQPLSKLEEGREILQWHSKLQTLCTQLACSNKWRTAWPHARTLAVCHARQAHPPRWTLVVSRRRDKQSKLN